MSVNRAQRHSRINRCPVCDGGENDPRGQERRCTGWTSDDGNYVHCSREEHAGSLDMENGGTYAHFMHGICRCGTQHGEARSRVDIFEATYDYYNESGSLLFQVVRKPGKQFRQRVPDGAGGWIWKLGETRRVPYRLPELLRADPSRTVYICEGEKDVENLMLRGVVATCNPMGAGKWAPVAETACLALQGRDVVIIADADDVGRKHAADVATSLQEVARSIRVTECPWPHKDVTDLFNEGGTLADLVEPDAPAPLVKSPATRARELAQLGPVTRLSTGLPTLDKSCRGGLPTNRLVVFGGAPGAGKTSLATWLGWQWAKTGVPVAILAVDEGPEGVLMRIAQMEGISPTSIEERDPVALERLAAILEPAPLILVDGDDAMGTIEGVGELLAKHDAPARVLIVDSMQTVRAAGTDDADSPRTRVDAVTVALKHQRNAHQFLIIATCELARGSYRNRAQADNINDLAAFKESGGIEYAAQTALVLRSVADETSLVDVAVPKNRAYQKDAFRLRMDFRLASFSEVEDPNVDTPDSIDAVKARKSRKGIQEDSERLFALVLGRPGLGRRQLRLEAQTVLSWGVQRLDVAFHALGDRVEVRQVGLKQAIFARGADSTGTG